MISRREMFAGFAVVPFAAALEIAGGDRTSGTSGTAAAEPKRKFAQMTGREMLRQRYFPNTPLTTSDGRKVRFYDDLLKDKIVILNLMYARCEGICSAATANLKSVRKLLREQINHDIFIYSLTLKPEEDSPAALQEYAEMHGVDTDPHWLFLTGKPEEVDVLRHKLGFADPDPEVDRDKSRHSGMLRYGNEPQCIWGTCQGSAEADWIAQEIGFAIPRAMKRNPAVNE
jgi:protein SCO1/2